MEVIVDLDDTLCNTTKDLRGSWERIPYLTLAAGAMEFLDAFKGGIVLLSAGNAEMQAWKLRVLNIESRFRQVIVVPTPEEKEAALRQLVEVSPLTKLVVGDRIDSEIRFGNQLGCRTVRVRLAHGRYAHLEPRSPEETPWKTVVNPGEVPALFL